MQNGFTLIELMVSLSIFSIVMVISVGTLLIMIDINAKAQAVYSASTNLSFALDSMTREIRTGDHYYCASLGATLPVIDTTNDCVGGHGIAFIRGRDDWQIGYRLNGSRIEQKVNNPFGAGDIDWVEITADDVVIQEFELTVENTDTNDATGDTEQPTVDVLVKGYVNNGLDTNTDFNIQTHVVQRLLDR
jgi:prepilin-type N-terminal cleavage/methylation domain-containing protein